ncbi:MAG: HlyC/CorC family transporter [Eggerthellaceae bacterium]|jgi:putative hemolysin|nr:HlyC/CorC family transporter [Eggerthellaceae bacterium]
MDSNPDKPKPGLLERLGLSRSTTVSEEEIKGIVADAEELLDDEKRMIHDIMDLGDTSVREIMQPRVDMMLVEDDATVRAALERMRGTGYSRLPVYHDDMDNIVGIVHYKDLVPPLMDGKDDEPVTKFMFEPLFVPESKDVMPLLGEMQAARHQMAIVVDEYGGTDGLITVEDIVEEIVGEIVDETDLDRPLITVLDGDGWRVDGSFPVEEALGLGWPVVDSDDYETVAGWLMDAFDSVPQTGDEFEVEGFTFKVEKMRRSRISTIRVQKLPQHGAEDPSGETTGE